VALKPAQNLLDVIARVDNDRLAAAFIAEKRTVAG